MMAEQAKAWHVQHFASAVECVCVSFCSPIEEAVLQHVRYICTSGEHQAKLPLRTLPDSCVLLARLVASPTSAI